MINFNKFNVNILSFFISSIIFLILISIINYPKISNNNNLNIIKNNSIDSNEIESENIKEITKWTIEIKSLGIKANINQMEGVTPSEDYVGHFKDTDILGKNIALIAFNYGATKNYFANLKDLKAGEEVIYTVNNEIKKYRVISNQIIEKDSLNSILKDYNNGGLKLFTYVKDLDNYLRYVYAQEIIDI